MTTTNNLSEIGFEINYSNGFGTDEITFRILQPGLQVSGMELTADIVKANILQGVSFVYQAKPRKLKGEKKGRDSCVRNPDIL